MALDQPELSPRELAVKFLKQNNGSLSRRARENEFAALTPEEAAWVETVYASAFPAAPSD